MPFLLVVNLVLPLVQTWVLVQPMPDLGFWDGLNYFSSVWAFYALVTNIAAGAKVPWGQRWWPYDARVRAHIVTTLGLAVAVVYHAAYKFVSGTSIDLWAWVLIGVLGMMLVLGTAWVYLPKLVKRLSISYDRNKAFHRWFVVALLVLVPLHVADGSLFSLIPAASAAGYLVPWAAVLALYLGARMGLGRRWGTITHRTVEGDRLHLRVKPDRPLRYRAGQFAFVDGHPFSFLSLPADPELAFVVRIRGRFTQALAGRTVGDRVQIQGGFGHFAPGPEPTLCFIAAGVGAVPVLNLLKDLRARGDRRPVLVFLSLRPGELLPDDGWLQSQIHRWPELRLRLIDGRTPAHRFSGEFFRAELDRPLDYRYYLCASPRVRADVLQGLRSLGVSPRQVRYEEFSFGTGAIMT